MSLAAAASDSLSSDPVGKRLVVDAQVSRALPDRPAGGHHEVRSVLAVLLGVLLPETWSTTMPGPFLEVVTLFYLSIGCPK